ncbi:MAG: DUF29 domain-containing protein [Cyanobacterium sp. T60_A2020_053]|nr:DUF29 domain-containing protein [Cyanobacterium sp. T60_A2020_053]
MVQELIKQEKSLYDTDYNLWILKTVEKLAKRDLDSLDWENLIEEVLDLRERKRRKMESLLMRLIEHLLKLGYWEVEREKNRGHWEGEIANLRKLIRKELKASPSLKRYLEEIFDESYQDARDIACKRSRLPLNTFPQTPITDLEQILDENWLP